MDEMRAPIASALVQRCRTLCDPSAQLPGDLAVVDVESSGLWRQHALLQFNQLPFLRLGTIGWWNCLIITSTPFHDTFSKSSSAWRAARQHCAQSPVPLILEISPWRLHESQAGLPIFDTAPGRRHTRPAPQSSVLGIQAARDLRRLSCQGPPGKYLLWGRFLALIKSKDDAPPINLKQAILEACESSPGRLPCSRTC